MTNNADGQRWRTALLTVAAIGLACAWAIVLSDPYYRSSLAALGGRTASGPAAPARLDSAAEEIRDPRLRSSLPECGAARLFRRATRPGSNGFLVAALGDCGSCCQLNLPKLYRYARQSGLTVVAFSDGTSDNVDAFRQVVHRDGADIQVFRDADHRLTRGVNAYYSGRLYWYTPKWRLRWREQDMEIDNSLFQTDRFTDIAKSTAP